MSTKYVLVIFASIICSTQAARILGFVPSPAYSHQIVFQPLWRELSLRGHQVTTMTTDPINDPLLVNLTEIDLSFSYTVWNEKIQQVIDSSHTNMFQSFHFIVTTMNEILDVQLGHKPVKDLIDSDAKFDLVIVEYLIPTTSAFAERFQCPFIGVISMDAHTFMHKIVGNPTHPVLYPDLMFSFGQQLTFLEWLKSTVVSFIIETYMEAYLFKKAHSVIKKHFGNNYPPVETLGRNVSMLFLNTDPIFHKVRPLVPSVIQIGGGSHRQHTSKPLPMELKKVLDEAKNGFIYFSLGSIVKGEHTPKDFLGILLATFAELPYTILWKFELEHVADKPKNVIVSKWFPQQDVFKHHNIKLCITQGGQQSLEEAIYEHIPMIGIPFFGDQPYNVKKMVEKGFGLSVNYRQLEKDHFKETILEVINNPIYREKITKFVQLAKDQPMTGMERAVWWTEYVIRHKGAKHLRSPILDIPTYQYLLLDVIGVLLLSFVVLIYVVIVVTKLIVKSIKYVRYSVSKSKKRQ